MTAPAPLRGTCGSYAGYQQHALRKEPPCEPCRAAYRQYMRDLRARRGPGYDRWWNKTRAAALQRLCEEYPERFRELLAEERKDGPTPWDPPGT